MECPFHAGSEAITACVQCETPICPLCASETNQVHLCMNCYRARVEEISADLSSASARLAKERQKGEAKSRASRMKKGEAPPAPAAQTPYARGPAESLLDREGLAGAQEIIPPAGEVQATPGTLPAAGAAAVIMGGDKSSKKELARMQKEEAKRLKAEEKAARKAAKRGAKAAPEVAAPPSPVTEPAPFFEPTPEPPTFAPPAEAPSSFENIPPLETAPLVEEIPPLEAATLPEPMIETELPMAPPPVPETPPPGYPAEPPGGGIRMPSLDERLEPLPPQRGEDKGQGLPPGMEPPEGFFD